MTTLRGLSPRTDAWFVGEVRDLGDAVALRTPHEPLFRYGNALVLPRAPRAGERAAVEARFAAAFADLPDVRHVTVLVDDPTGAEGDLGAWTDAGYEVARNVVRSAPPDALAATEGAHPDLPDAVTLHPVTRDADWAAVRDLQADEGPPGESRAAYLAFLAERTAFLRRLADGAHPNLRGGWFLARWAGAPAGSLGLYVRDGLARYQFVHVRAAYRRRGLAAALLRDAARHAARHWGAERLVIVGDAGSAADRLYARIGFTATERDVSASRPGPPEGP